MIHIDRMTRQGRLVGLVVLGMVACAEAQKRDTAECVVKSVADGDSFTCADRSRVRLLGIDAPERDQAPFGAEARRHLLTLMPIGATLRLETDMRPRDQHGRILAYAYDADGRMINEAIARAGYVTVLSYAPNVRHIERIRKAVRQARTAKRGLWKTKAFDCSPLEHRRGRC